MFGEMYIYNKTMSFLLDGIFSSLTYSTCYNTHIVEITMEFIPNNEPDFNVFNDLNGKSFNFVFFAENGIINKGGPLYFPIMGINTILTTYTSYANINNDFSFEFTLNVDFNNFKKGEENVNPIFV